MLNLLHTVQVWLLTTTLGNTVLGWVGMGVATLLFKPRSPEAYAALASRKPVVLFSRFAALLQLMGALGLDPARVASAFFKVVTGKVKPVEVMQGGLDPLKLQATEAATDADTKVEKKPT